MTGTIVLPKNHPFLTSAQEIDEILEPIKPYGVTTFTFMRKFNDGKQIYLSNNAAWVEDYYNEALFGQFISNHPKNYQTSYLIWPQNSDLTVFQLARERYDSGNGATFIKSHEDYTDFYFFSGQTENTKLVNFYINYTDVLEKFILYFEDRAEKIIAKSNQTKIILPKPDQKKIDEETLVSISDSEIEQTLHKLRLRKYRLKQKKYQGVKLSGRELDAISYYMNGLTAKETAKKMGISPRTVESYFENIKYKLGCNNKDEIVQILSDDGFGG